jgi:hypothetical protein
LAAIIVLGICGILISVAIITLRSQVQAHSVRSTPASKNMPRVISEWHYRPKEAVRRHALGSAETLDVVTPEYFALDIDSPEYALRAPNPC